MYTKKAFAENKIISHMISPQTEPDGHSRCGVPSVR